MELAFRAEAVHWRGPAPYVFVPVPAAESEQIAAVAPLVSYGWGVIPVEVRLGSSRWTTSLFPKDGGYLVPLRVAERRREGVEVGDVVDVRLRLDGLASASPARRPRRTSGRVGG